jgi:hypothetical protein
LPKPLVEQVITTGATLTPKALNEIDKIGKKLAKHGIHETEDYSIHPVVDQPVVGGRLNFRKLFRKIKKFFKPVAKALKPIARPLLKAGANALVTGIAASTGNPQFGAMLMPAVNSGIDAAGDAHGFGFKPLKPFRKVTRPALRAVKSLGAGTKKRKGRAVATSRTKGSEAAKRRMAAVRCMQFTFTIAWIVFK